MKEIIFVLFMVSIFGISAFAQKPKSKVPLPAGIASWEGDYSSKILDDPTIDARLKKLLGAKNYVEFKKNWETLDPLNRRGNILSSSGCLIHGCLHVESAVAVDLKNNTIHAAIYNEPNRVKYFNERGSRTPKPILAWASRFKPSKN